MRRLLFLAVFSCLLLPSCSKVSLYVKATIVFHSTDGYDHRFGPVDYNGFAGRKLKSDEIYSIFDDLRLEMKKDFDSADLTLQVFDSVADDFLYTKRYRFNRKQGASLRGYEYVELKG